MFYLFFYEDVLNRVNFWVSRPEGIESMERKYNFPSASSYHVCSSNKQSFIPNEFETG